MKSVTNHHTESSPKTPESIIQDNYDDIYKFCFWKIRNAEDAQDITQEVFYRFIHNYDRYNHLLALLPGQASLFANILQQYMSYEIGGAVMGLPVMIGIVYFVLLVTCVFMLYRRLRRLQVS